MPAPPQIPFTDLLAAFDLGVAREANASGIPVPNPVTVHDYLRKVYEDRHNRKNLPAGSNVTLSAQILGMIAFAMFRSELPQTIGNPHIPHVPIDPAPTPGNALENRHVDHARELYGFYTNSAVAPAMANPLVASLPLDKDGREIDQPCPLCP